MVSMFLANIRYKLERVSELLLFISAAISRVLGRCYDGGHVKSADLMIAIYCLPCLGLTALKEGAARVSIESVFTPTCPHIVPT